MHPNFEELVLRLIFREDDVLLQESWRAWSRDIKTFPKSYFLTSEGRYRVTDSFFGKISEKLFIEIEVPIEVDVTFEAQINANEKGAIAYANAPGAKAYASRRGAKAYANVDGAEAHAITPGAEAHANKAGANAYATTWGAKAYSNAEESYAYVVKGAKAYWFGLKTFVIPLS